MRTPRIAAARQADSNYLVLRRFHDPFTAEHNFIDKSRFLVGKVISWSAMSFLGQQCRFPVGKAVSWSAKPFPSQQSRSPDRQSRSPGPQSRFLVRKVVPWSAKPFPGWQSRFLVGKCGFLLSKVVLL